METFKRPLFGLSLTELDELVLKYGGPRFSGVQIAHWLYQKWVSDFDEMTNVSKSLRSRLAEDFTLGVRPHSRCDVSHDGTKKYLFPAEGKFVEAAFIPETKRKTLCLSSQVGCKMGCLFCMTGKQGFQAQLSAGEILNQVRSLPEGREITHIVYMGMGEPFDNLENVLKSLEILTAPWGMGFSPQKVTVSTVGIIPGIREFMARSSCRFALSLHTPFEEERQKLMPVENIYPLSEVIEVLKGLQHSHSRRLSIEYICFADLNDTSRHVKELVRILHGLKVRVNLIRFHPIPGTPLRGSSEAAMESFRDGLAEKGIPATIRKSRGEDIWAACGLLSTKAILKEAPAEDY